MSTSTSLFRAQIDPHYDAIVVGSGIGGLSTAACLAKGGQKVLVLERHYTAGGFTHTFARQNYQWDVGVHYVGDVHRPRSKTRRIFDYITDGKLSWQPMADIYDSIEYGGQFYDLPAGRERFRSAMGGYFPEERQAIDRYLELLRQVSNAATGYFTQRALPAWLGQTFFNTLSQPFLTHASQTTAQVLGTLTTNSTLTGVLTGQWGDYGLPPAQSSFAMHALVASHYLDGANYPIGGSEAIAANIAPVIQGQGGSILTGAEVTGIAIENNRAVGVILRGGRRLKAKNIISAVGAANTYRHLLKDEAYVPRDAAAYLRAEPGSVAHLCLYIGVRGTAKALGLKTTNLWLHRSAATDPQLRDLAALVGDVQPLVFISFPSAKDPHWEEHHPGLSTIEIVVPTPYARFAAWQESSWHRRGPDYEALKARLSELLLEILFSVRPDLRPHIDCAELSTPLSTRHFANYGHGEIYGLPHDPQRFQQAWLRVDTPLKNLYLTGQDIVTCGVGGALMAGVLAASRILAPTRAAMLLKGTMI